MGVFTILTVFVVVSSFSVLNVLANVALGKMVRESSSAAPFNSYLVVDGMNSAPYCYKSQTSGSQWIQIDLIWLHQVDYVRVFGKLSTNILNVKLTSPNNLTNIVCSNQTDQAGSINVVFQCSDSPEHSSKYVTIYQNSTSTDIMNICEVVVDGQWVLRSPLNFASDGEVVREVASAREQDMEIYEKRKGHEQLDEQQS
ncbi:hypothetical protein HELRODRAFT_179320 [Helobdella robusta]|uniref:Fucolectin tachylectin-4 pentraxin-1 domain-containing protein n=1 Tax=Helobdella robusta TaxID=6412 RepID=T1FEJ4_HELRO|nr:hypothetical protein HELRODRAFT_179320 [Helobdella robusta]ESN95544.1 hypothetical protein HELRODRAFT_179320 [Helobdella robusta]